MPWPTVANRLAPPPNPRYLAYARAVIAFGGEPEGTNESAVRLARWLETGGWQIGRAMTPTSAFTVGVIARSDAEPGHEVTAMQVGRGGQPSS